MSANGIYSQACAISVFFPLGRLIFLQWRMDRFSCWLFNYICIREEDEREFQDTLMLVVEVICAVPPTNRAQSISCTYPY